MKLIDKDAVVAKIEKWRDGIKKGIFSIPLTGSDRAYATFEYEMLGKVKDFLDTPEVKEVDLDKEIDLAEDKYHGFESLSRADIIELIKHFFELGLSVSNKAEKEEEEPYVMGKTGKFTTTTK